MHRRIMGISFTEEDKEGLTMPEIFLLSCLSASTSQLDNRPIDFGKIKRATEELSERYDFVLLEGAGGLMVPLTTELLTIDYIAQENYPLIFVTSGKLGSINHTLLSLEAIQKHGIVLDTVLYNMYPTVKDKTIQNDTMNFIQNWLKKYFPDTKFILVPEIKRIKKTYDFKRLASLFAGLVFCFYNHFSILRVSALKFTPILKSFRSSISKGRA